MVLEGGSAAGEEAERAKRRGRLSFTWGGGQGRQGARETLATAERTGRKLRECLQKGLSAGEYSVCKGPEAALHLVSWQQGGLWGRGGQEVKGRGEASGEASLAGLQAGWVAELGFPWSSFLLRV